MWAALNGVLKVLYWSKMLQSKQCRLLHAAPTEEDEFPIRDSRVVVGDLILAEFGGEHSSGIDA